MRPSQIAALLSLSSLLFAASTAPTQSAVSGSSAAAPAAQPSIRTGSNLVLVDVVATDHDRPVLDLNRSAFHIFEDGKEQAISSFEEHRPAPALPAYLAAPLAPDTYSNAPVYSKSSAVNVLLLDALNTPVGDQLRVRQKMIDYLATVKPGTPLAIFALSSQLRLVTDFTTDAAALARELKNRKGNPQESALLNSQQTNDLNTNQVNAVGSSPTEPTAPGGAASNPINGLKNAAGGGGAMSAADELQQFEADQTAFQTEVRLKITLSAMQQLAGYLRPIEGRKNVIWFSEAFPLSVFADPTSPLPFANINSFRVPIQKAADALTAARVAIYAVDARGLMAPYGMNATNRTPAPSGERLAYNVSQDDEEQHNEQAAMQEVAEDTGGRAFLNTNDLDKAMAAAVDDGASYYTLTYVLPSERLDGKYHKLEVKVDGERGLKLAYRRGFYADALDQTTPNGGPDHGVFATALAPDAPEATAILLKARILPATDPAFSGVSIPDGSTGQNFFPFSGAPHRYIVDLTIDPNGLAFSGTPEGDQKASIELGMIAYAADGKHLNDYSHGFQLALKAAQVERLKASGITVRLPFDLPPGKVDLRIGVHDLNADRAGSLDVALQVPQ